MSAPSALTVVYPPSFQNSFWSYPSYRKGAQSLYSKLQSGIDENQSILAFIAHRAELEYTHAEALATPPPQTSLSAPLFKQAAGILQDVLSGPLDPSSSLAGIRGYASNNSATSQAFRLVQAETTTSHANAHGKTARLLEQTVLEPFGKWALEHHERVTESWQHVDHALKAFERQKTEVEKLKSNYDNKCRAADEAHDDLRFAPLDETSATTTSPTLASPSKLRVPQQKQRTVSGGSSKSLESHSSTEDTSDIETLKRRETLRKQFGFTQRATSGQIDLNNEAFAGVKLPPLPTETEGESLDPVSKSGLKRSGTISAFVHSAVDKMPAPIKAAVGGVVSGGESRHSRLRRDADNAEKVYEEAVRNLDRTRCQVEEVLFQHYGLTQRWEVDRIRAVHSVLASYNKAVSAQMPALQQSLSRGDQLYQGLNPALELRAMIREARTGPFQPAIERFQPYYHDDVSSAPFIGLAKNGGFGLDLALVERLEYLDKHDEPAQSGSTALAALPPVLEALLSALDRAYADDDRWSIVKSTSTQSTAEEELEDGESKSLTQGQEKRKTWVLEVPLGVTHRLRDALIAHLHPSHADMMYGTASHDSTRSVPVKMLDGYDPPVLAACIKLWLLELQHSLITDDLWDSIDAIYRAAAGQEREALLAHVNDDADAEQTRTNSSPPLQTAKVKAQKVDTATEEKIRAGVLEDLRVVLGKLPKIHLACLDAIMAHLHGLVTSTKSAESDAVYLNKLGLALGRALLRPPVETRYTLSVPNPTLVVMDLVQHYTELFPAVMEKKRVEGTAVGTRGAPSRKRTKPVDQRISRSSIGSDLQQGAKKLMEQLDERERGPQVPTTQQDTATALAPEPQSQADDNIAATATPAAPPSVVTSDLNTQEAKAADDSSAPTPLGERVLGRGTDANPDNMHALGSPKEAETMPVSDEHDQDRPLSNVARLSRQFNSANQGSADSATSGRVRIGSSGATAGTGPGVSGVPRGPRPAGARAARASGQF